MTGVFARAFICFLSAVIGSACAGGVKDAADLPAPSGADPRNAVYTIEDRAVPLINGRFADAAAPGSAAMVTATVFGRPLFGDLDGDGDEDAVVVIVYEPGGSGTFYYIAAAVNQNGRFTGTAGHLLGDRIIARFVRFDDGLVEAHYLDRRPTEPMSAPPTIRKVTRLRLTGGKLAPLKPDARQEQVVEGWVTIGHEVRSFMPCASRAEHWLMGNSPALKEIAAAYRKALPEARPYTPVFMSLAGKFEAPPADGFGADYSTAFSATRLVQVPPAGNCRRDFIVVTSPRPGAEISPPLKIRGQARGTWFFEGDFPVILKDARGRIMARGYVTARGPWMTREFVPFEGSLTFKIPVRGGRGTLVFKKDNPTDRPELDDEMELPVQFK